MRAAPIISLVLLALALSGCPGGGGGEGSALEGGTITLALPTAPRAIDPALACRRDAEAEPLLLAYTPPLTYRRADGAEGTELAPGVAARVPEAEGDGRTYVLRVRPDLRFSNGRLVRASDVRHTILRARALGPVGRRLFAGVRSLRADDERGTLRIVLRRPDPSFPHSLAAVQAGVVPAATPVEDRSRRPPPGVGPYRIVLPRPGRGYLLRRDRDFSLPGVPGGRLDGIRVTDGGTAQAQTDAVIADQLDVMTVAAAARPPAGAALRAARPLLGARRRSRPATSRSACAATARPSSGRRWRWRWTSRRPPGASAGWCARRAACFPRPSREAVSPTTAPGATRRTTPTWSRHGSWSRRRVRSGGA